MSCSLTRRELCPAPARWPSLAVSSFKGSSDMPVRLAVTVPHHPLHLLHIPTDIPGVFNIRPCCWVLRSRKEGLRLLMATFPVHDSDAHKYTKYKKKKSFCITWLTISMPRSQRQSSTGLLHPSLRAFFPFLYTGTTSKCTYRHLEGPPVTVINDG